MQKTQLSFKKIFRLPFFILIYFYKYCISPLIGPRCRFVPSCSEYALQAIKIHGVFKGCYLITKRLLKCQPFGPSGYDPVPNLKIKIK